MTKTNSADFDLAVIGGGISGLGIASEGARAGMRVLLLERGSALAQEASANSLRIIHGGFRYLQSLNISRVLESLKAQQEILKRFPNFVTPLGCFLPIESGGARSRIPLQIAITLFQGCARICGVPQRKNCLLSPSQTNERLPALAALFPNGALYWEDVLMTDPDALAKQVAAEAQSAGALLLTHHEVVSIAREHGAFCVRSKSSQQLRSDYAARVAVAVGSSHEDLTREPPLHCLLHAHAWVCAFNLVVRKSWSERYAFALRSRAGRSFFFVPRGKGTAIGTGQAAAYDRSAPSERVIAQFLAEVSECLPIDAPMLNDIESVEYGFLPARSANEARQKLYGSALIGNENGYLELLSTKYTTFLREARKVVASAAAR